MTNKTKIVISIVAVLILAGGGALYATNRGQDDSSNDKADVSGQLDRENRQDDSESVESEDSSNTPSTSNSSKAQANPILSRWSKIDDSVEAAGFMQGVYEDGGTCTFTFSKDAYRITKTSTGFKDATTTNCPPIQIALSEFPEKGDWKVQLSYESAAASGASSSQTLNL